VIEALFLRSLIERIESKIGPVSIGDVAWHGDRPPEPDKLASGWYRLAFAVVMARDALPRGDERQISVEAALCQALEREAEAIAVRSRQRRGGAKRGQQQRKNVEPAFRPYKEHYESLVAQGKKPAVARRVVMNKMTVDGFVHPTTGEVPTDKTVRKHLVKNSEGR
jgi:hypothetical protein